MCLAALASVSGPGPMGHRGWPAVRDMLIILFRNDGTGNKDVGNYEVTVRVNQFELERARIEGHKRADGWRELVRMLLEKGEDD